MEFIAMDKESLKVFKSEDLYILLVVTDSDNLCLELEKDPHRKSIFTMKTKNGKVDFAQTENMFKYIANYVDCKHKDKAVFALCLGDDLSSSKAMADVFSDVFKIKRELQETDSVYRSVYTEFYNVAASLNYLPRM